MATDKPSFISIKNPKPESEAEEPEEESTEQEKPEANESNPSNSKEALGEEPETEEVINPKPETSKKVQEEEKQEDEPKDTEEQPMKKSQGTGVFDADPDQLIAKSKKSKPSKTTVTSTPSMNSNISSVVVPASLVLAGNLLVVIVMIFMSQQAELWKYIMGFAAIEVLLGSTLWYVMNQ